MMSPMVQCSWALAFLCFKSRFYLFVFFTLSYVKATALIGDGARMGWADILIPLRNGVGMVYSKMVWPRALRLHCEREFSLVRSVYKYPSDTISSLDSWGSQENLDGMTYERLCWCSEHAKHEKRINKCTCIPSPWCADVNACDGGLMGSTPLRTVCKQWVCMYSDNGVERSASCRYPSGNLTATVSQCTYRVTLCPSTRGKKAPNVAPLSRGFQPA